MSETIIPNLTVFSVMRVMLNTETLVDSSFCLAIYSRGKCEPMVAQMIRRSDLLAIAVVAVLAVLTNRSDATELASGLRQPESHVAVGQPMMATEEESGPMWYVSASAMASDGRESI